MATNASNTTDGEDVNDFLRRIKELGDKRDREDEERTRRLEEEILAGRRERQARRAERARSISPQKSSPTASPSTTAGDYSPSRSQQLADPPVNFSQTSRSSPQSRNEIMENTNGWFRDKQAAQEPAPPRSPSPSKQTGSLGRSGTLSWQQRPSSRDSNSSRSRPLSSLAIENAAAKAAATPPKQSPTEDVQMSRGQIAQSLSSKDPAWFRQTADRGVGSAAYRRNQEDNMSDLSSNQSNRRLPGMSRESTSEPEGSSETASEYDRSTAPSNISRATPTVSDRYPSISSISSGGLGPPRHMSVGQESDPSYPEAKDTTLANRPAMSPTQSRIGSERPPSPTKGLGGFVQSAMMKRSDSVNKRWSAQHAGGISRGNSITGNRGGIAGLGLGLDPGPSSQDDKKSLDVIKDTTEGTPTSTKHDRNNMTEKSNPDSKVDTARPLPLSTSTKSLPTQDLSDSNLSRGPDSVPTSPTKTMDPRRWSPTKASWLESALNKPESPRVKSLAPQQPTWMSEIQKTKQAKADGEDIKSPKLSYKEVQTAALLRSPPLGGHNRPLSISGMPEGIRYGTSRSPSPTKMTSVTFNEAPEPESKAQPSTLPKPEPTTEPEVGTTKEAKATREEAPPTEKENIQLKDYEKSAASDSPSMKPLVKPKPQTPPKTDLRAGLKARQKSSDGKPNEELEFKNVFGNLKKTQTKNYVAPDAFKNNILQGKAALNVTGGPKKTARVDEFKDSILKQKEAMKAGGGSILKRDNEAPAPRKPSSSVPEALAKRNMLGRSDVANMSPATDAPVRPSWKARTSSQEKSAASVTDKDKVVEAKPSARQTQASEKPSPKKTSTSSEKGGPSSGKETTSIIGNSKLVSEPQSFAKPEPIKPKGASSSGSGNSKLADRLNPALLNILSRGPSPRPTSGAQSSEDSASKPSATSKEPDTETAGGTLTHMTKGRARGPKRRLPNAPQDTEKSTAVKKDGGTSAPAKKNVPASASVPQIGGERAASSPRPLADLINNTDRVRRSEPERGKSTSPTKSKGEMVSVDQAKSEHPLSPSDKPKPKVAVKSPDLRKISSQKEQPAEVLISASVVKAQEDPSTEKLSNEGETKSQTPSTTRFSGWSSPKPEPKVSPTLLKPSILPPKGPPIPPKSPDATLQPPPSSPQLANGSLNDAGDGDRPTEKALAADGSSTISDIFSLFFDTAPSVTSKVDVDPQNSLLLSTDPDSVKTTRSEVSSITGDGKTMQLPQNQEYTFHSDQMYLVVHEFTQSESSRKENEVYLWTGSEVPAPSIEDAQLFSRKVAREHSTKLQHVPSGKETSRFFSALGGVGIFRHQSSHRSTESSFYMLRARRHLSHIAFDEIPLTPTSLCSGFCYIISAKFGRLYLWKGKGALADELGTARLIGMNLSLLGEIEEINEGEEPDAFFESFPSSSATAKDDVPLSSLHWSMKSRNEKYEPRLFKIDHASSRPSSSGGLGSFWGRRGSFSPAKPAEPVTEITPFAQSDLKDNAVFVLDAWFEIYVYVPPTLNSKSKRAPEFSTALHFAQEYSLLSVSLQDRPLMPAVKILLGGTTRDFRLCFRAWDDNKTYGDDLDTDTTTGSTRRVIGGREGIEGLAA